jgi:ABC-type long-subunit fatty acid transport system fused permease/ATPase subunit
LGNLLPIIRSLSTAAAASGLPWQRGGTVLLVVVGAVLNGQLYDINQLNAHFLNEFI